MGVTLSLNTQYDQIAPAQLATQNRWFSLGNPYNLASLMGVTLSLNTQYAQIAPAQLTTQNRWFSSGNPYNLASLMGEALSLNTHYDRVCSSPADHSESMVFLRKSIQSGLSNGGGAKPQYALRSRLLQPS